MEEKKYVPLDDVVAIIDRYRSYYDNHIPNVNYKLIIAALSKLRNEKGV